MAEFIEKWNDKDSVNFIRKGLIKYNASCLPDEIKSPLDQFSLLIRDTEGYPFGGVTGTIFWQHLHIDFLWVDIEYRGKGYGSQLLKKAERVAKDKHCRIILLDTFSFQAPDFYKKHGYVEYGIIQDHPKGFSQHFFQKRL
ncbi:GNAT family N-acetyltransferase [Sporolactobacillus laevolacticus]|uniref:Acetyltransferase n=1 Tax=Sporolactobacillus laevolacticus DSM 442 TaxID=1395513 RepID=V6IV13_9BACL|nr:GNAT family N-acetyltransferase [Sporolactobacillus laevolacticus]EST11033.1 acetyltransferase [Sporolactobacillus laevolacticus DSM 442]